MLLWQAPQAMRLGLFFQLSPWGTAPGPVVPGWQAKQLVTGCGNLTSLM